MSSTTEVSVRVGYKYYSSTVGTRRVAARATSIIYYSTRLDLYYFKFVHKPSVFSPSSFYPVLSFFLLVHCSLPFVLSCPFYYIAPRVLGTVSNPHQPLDSCCFFFNSLYHRDVYRPYRTPYPSDLRLSSPSVCPRSRALFSLRTESPRGAHRQP